MNGSTPPGSVRGAYPATEHDAARAFVASFYPLHTGEAGGTIGRALVMFIGLWLATVIIFGVLLWYRRSSRRIPGNADAADFSTSTTVHPNT